MSSHQGKIIMQYTIRIFVGCNHDDSFIRIGDICDGGKSQYFYHYRSLDETYNVGDIVGFDTETQPISGGGQAAWRALGKTPPMVTVAINLVPLTAVPQFKNGQCIGITYKCSTPDLVARLAVIKANWIAAGHTWPI